VNDHTPGPWVLNFYGPDDDWVRTAKGDAIVEVGHNQLQREANAKLIAAGPDLLEALQEFADDAEARWDMQSRRTNPGIKHCVKQARAAIAKATK
jgi:hypothetical protein